jgi:hypothetical protein
LHRLDNCLANAGRIAKTNFAFRRMDVDVYFTWIQINEQKRNRKLSAHESGVITFAQGGREDSAVNRASVYENELLCSRLPAHPSATDPALNLNTTPITQGNFEQVVEELGTIEIADPVSQRGRYRQLRRNVIFPHQGEANLGMGQRLQKKLMLDISRFRRFGAQKFSARRHIVKQRTHFDLRPRRFAAVAHRLDPSTVYENFRAGDRTGLASAQPQA